jgi:hypothetical protein
MELKVHKDCKVYKESKVIKEIKVMLELRGLWVRKDYLDYQELMD